MRLTFLWLSSVSAGMCCSFSKPRTEFPCKFIASVKLEMAVKFCLWKFRTNVPPSVFEPPAMGCWRTSCRRVAATAPPKEPWSSFSSPPPSASLQRRSWPSERWRSLSWLRSRGEEEEEDEECWMFFFFFYLSPFSSIAAKCCFTMYSLNSWLRYLTWSLQISESYWLQIPLVVDLNRSVTSRAVAAKSLPQLTGSQCMMHCTVYMTHGVFTLLKMSLSFFRVVLTELQSAAEASDWTATRRHKIL